MESLESIVVHTFQKQYNLEPWLVRSPARVNLIGEHTDYNEGFVLPAAVNKYIYLALAPNENSTSRIYSIDMDQEFVWDINAIEYPKSDLGWPNYIMGCVDQLRQAGYPVAGFECVFGGNIPIGSGMSSSAALEGAIICGLSEVFGFSIDKIDRVKLGQKAENEFVGVQCGIMDQFANVFSQAEQVFKLDCRSLEYEYYPFEQSDIKILLCDTQVRRELAGSEYNVRRAQCEKGVGILQQYYQDISSFRDVTLQMLGQHKEEFDDVVFRRCSYVVQENLRVNGACLNLIQNDFDAFGKKMYQSHAGLRDEYEVSSPELDLLVKLTENIDGVLGARMMGAGFGGCTINLVRADVVSDFKERIRKGYNGKMAEDVLIYECSITGGVQIVSSKK